MDLSIVIVNYNTKDLTLQCIESIYQNSPKRYSIEIFVVDNDSKDGSPDAIAEAYPEVNLIRNGINAGFAAANNIAIRQAKGRYALLLNSDTVVIKDCLAVMIKYMDENKEVGAAGCKVVLPDGSLDVACKRSFPTPENSFYHAMGLSAKYPNHKKYGEYNLTYLDEDKLHEVDCLVGAFMILRKEVIAQVGMLDEKYFMYGEDIDWCYRIKEAGWKIVYNPKAKVIHYKGASSKKKRWKIIYEFHRAMYLFFNDHYKNKYNLAVRILVYLGIGAKFAQAAVKNIYFTIRGVGKA